MQCNVALYFKIRETHIRTLNRIAQQHEHAFFYVEMKFVEMKKNIVERKFLIFQFPIKRLHRTNRYIFLKLV